jgi:hypothetical protein
MFPVSFLYDIFYVIPSSPSHLLDDWHRYKLPPKVIVLSFDNLVVHLDEVRLENVI